MRKLLVTGLAFAAVLALALPASAHTVTYDRPGAQWNSHNCAAGVCTFDNVGSDLEVTTSFFGTAKVVYRINHEYVSGGHQGIVSITSPTPTACNNANTTYEIIDNGYTFVKFRVIVGHKDNGSGSCTIDDVQIKYQHA